MAKRGGNKGKAQPRSNIQARYDAAGHGRRLRAWTPPSTGPNKALAGLQNIRNRNRDAERNDWAGESASQKWATALVGIGITPRFKRIKNADRRRAVADLFEDFSAKSDADHLLNYYGLITLGVRTWFGGGECFARRRYRRRSDGLPVPMQVQLLEPEMVPLLDADNWPGMPSGNKIRDGIEFDRRGFKVAVWFYKEHPGDGPTSSVGGDLLVRVPAEDVIHMFEPKRPGQRRGVPPAAAILTRLRGTGEYEDTVLERQKIANMFVGFLTRALPNGDWTQTGDIDPLTGQRVETDGQGAIIGMQPGLLQELDDGQSVTFANPPEAGTTYSDYIRTNHLGTSAASGLPYELFSGDIREISDRTLRVLINEFRRFAEQRQWQIVIPMFCQRIVDWFAEAAVLQGLVSPSEVNDVRRVEHAPHGWAHIHPVQDPQGKVIEIDNGLRSRSSVISASGEDPETVDDERAADKEREDRLGLTVLPPDPADDEDPDEPPGKPPAKPTPKKKAAKSNR
ncbi:MAG: phage portal protein [Hydrogenophaga sp.]|nr:phage portal protein [Hydrogenophaga sp.]